MKDLRESLSGDVRGTVEQARNLADWKYHARRHPWAVMAVVAVAGYAFVPRRKEIISPDAATLAKLADQDRLVVERHPRANSRGGLAGMLIGPIAAMLLRTAGNYVSMKVDEIMHDRADRGKSGRGDAERATQGATPSAAAPARRPR